MNTLDIVDVQDPQDITNTVHIKTTMDLSAFCDMFPQSVDLQIATYFPTANKRIRPNFLATKTSHKLVISERRAFSCHKMLFNVNIFNITGCGV